MHESERLKKILDANKSKYNKDSVFIETGSGLSTIQLSQFCDSIGTKAYSCDHNGEKLDSLREKSPTKLDNIQFLIGDSLVTLEDLSKNLSKVDLLFLDSAASALHTYREFQILERFLSEGSLLIIDNAKLPSKWSPFEGTRKGKILVPYLLAHPFWDVSDFPKDGGSMVFAKMMSKPEYSNHAYEAPDYVDNWKKSFNKMLD